MEEVRPGALLLATPSLLDPSFAGSVVLVLDADDDGGSLGVVLNRPSPIRVDSVLPGWGDHASDPPVLHHGGPLETDGALAVALRRTSGEPGPGLRAVVDRLALLDLDTPPELVVGDLARLRVFAGYAGWGTGQLAGEIAEGAWYVVPGQADDVFRDDPTDLRRDVLRRQPGDLALHLTRPRDPEQN